MSNKNTLQDNNAKLSNINETIKSLPNAYTLPIASPTELGGIKIGNGIECLEDGTVNVVAKYDDTQIKNDLNNKANKYKHYSNIVVPALGWPASAPFTQTVVVEGMVDDGIPLYDVVDGNNIKECEEFAYITKLETKNGSIILTAMEQAPAIDLHLRIEVLY